MVIRAISQADSAATEMHSFGIKHNQASAGTEFDYFGRRTLFSTVSLLPQHLLLKLEGLIF